MSASIEAVRLWMVLSRCHRAVGQIAERSVADAGLCLTDFAALEALLHKGPLTITEIQEKVLLASGSMTAAVDRLERKGLLIRTAAAEDRRAKRLELTAEGRAWWKRLSADTPQNSMRLRVSCRRRRSASFTGC